MKGFVVTSLITMLDRDHGAERVDAVIATAGLNGIRDQGADAFVPVPDMIRLCTHASRAFDVELDDMVEQFGWYVFETLTGTFPEFVNGSSFTDFIESIDRTVHAEVLKRFPDAEVPLVELVHADDAVILVRYRSRRPFTRLACGILGAAAAHFGVSAVVSVDTTEFDPNSETHQSQIEVRRLI